MNFTEEDIKRAFRLGWNSTDKYAKQKGYPTSQDECVEFLIKEKDSQKNSVIDGINICSRCNKNVKYQNKKYCLVCL